MSKEFDEQVREIQLAFRKEQAAAGMTSELGLQLASMIWECVAAAWAEHFAPLRVDEDMSFAVISLDDGTRLMLPEEVVVKVEALIARFISGIRTAHAEGMIVDLESHEIFDAMAKNLAGLDDWK